MKLKTAGLIGELMSDGDTAISWCGDIKDGVPFRFTNKEWSGGWCIDFKSLEKLYLAAKKLRQPKREEK